MSPTLPFKMKDIGEQTGHALFPITNEDDEKFANWIKDRGDCNNVSIFEMLRKRKRIEKDRLKKLQRERMIVVESMKRYGSAFESSLAHCIGFADDRNLLKIWRTWPELWDKYLD